MNQYTYKIGFIPEIEDLVSLYSDAEWSAYTENPAELHQAIKQSLTVWTAWEDEQLVGLTRVVGDSCTIIYIQDILVLKSHQRQGIGSELMRQIFEKYESVRQIILLTGNEKETRLFYESLGMTDVAKYDCVAYMK